MKKIFIACAAVAVFFAGSAFVSTSSLEKTTEFVAPKGEIKFNLKNDTGQNVNIHDGNGITTINSGSSKSFQKPAGTKFHMAQNGQKGNFLFEVKDGMEGKTFNLSSFRK